MRAALNVLRDSIETGRMPSGIALAPGALAMHAATITECERLLASGGAQQRAAHEAGWVTLTSAARMAEAIPVPSNLARYWPANDAT